MVSQTESKNLLSPPCHLDGFVLTTSLIQRSFRTFISYLEEHERANFHLTILGSGKGANRFPVSWFGSAPR